MTVLRTPLLPEVAHPATGAIHAHDEIRGPLAAITAETISRHQPQDATSVLGSVR